MIEGSNHRIEGSNDTPQSDHDLQFHHLPPHPPTHTHTHAYSHTTCKHKRKHIHKHVHTNTYTQRHTNGTRAGVGHPGQALGLVSAPCSWHPKSPSLVCQQDERTHPSAPRVRTDGLSADHAGSRRRTCPQASGHDGGGLPVAHRVAAQIGDHRTWNRTCD
jgi:hypothetical protein